MIFLLTRSARVYRSVFVGRTAAADEAAGILRLLTTGNKASLRGDSLRARTAAGAWALIATVELR
jgi:hypothetical protein